MGQALEQTPDLPYYLFRNEQAMVHAAAAFAKASFRMRTMVCTTPIGPGATNMVTGAAAATVRYTQVVKEKFATMSPTLVSIQENSGSTHSGMVKR